MPGRHHADNRPSPWLIIAIVIILAGLLAAGILLVREFGPGGKEPEPKGPDKSGAESLPIVIEATPVPENTPTPSPTPEPTPTPAPIPDNGEDGYLSEGIYIWNDMAFELFYGYDEASDPYAQAIDGFARDLPGDVKVYNMIVPNHSEYGLPERLRDSMGCNSQRDNIRYIYGTYKYAKGVDVCGTLDQHKGEYIYFNTDTHWTARGAYYAYEEFCKAADVPCSALEQFGMTAHERDFYGYLAEVTGEDCLYSNPDHVETFEPGYPYTAGVSYDGYDFTELEGVNSGDASMGYSMFLWGDQPCVRIKNENSYMNRKLAVVKESYGNAIGAFMGASFDEVYMIDFRSFEGSLPELVQEHGITDVLFLNSAVAANTYERVEYLRTLFPGSEG